MHRGSHYDAEVHFIRAMAHGIVHRIVKGDKATFPFGIDECVRLSRVYWGMIGERIYGCSVILLLIYAIYLDSKKNYELLSVQQDRNSIDGGIIRHVARAMEDITLSRQRHGYGTFQAQTEKQSVNIASSRRIRGLDSILSIFFFGIHLTYSRRLRDARYEGGVHMQDFRNLLSLSAREWTGKDMFLPTSIMLVY